MDKLTRQQEDVISQLMEYAYNKELTQFILNSIGKENWTKSILSNCMISFLTEEQKEISASLGWGYSFDEMFDSAIVSKINKDIVEKLKEQGVTKYIYENDDYIDAIKNKEIICEGINVDEIINDYENVKKMIYD